MNFLYDRYGNRKYTTAGERRKFLRVAKAKASRPVYTFCLVLAFTGARISEVLALTPRQIDFEAGVIVIRSLKKRKREGDIPVYRVVPVPARLLRELDVVHQVRALRENIVQADARIWPWGRTTAWKQVKEIMHEAGISGLQATPKGLRHGFAIAAIVAGVPLVIVKEWLGHARLETTGEYTKAVGAEARTIAKRMWGWRSGLGFLL